MPSQNLLPRKVNDVNSFTKAWNKIIDWMTMNTLQSSSDILVTQTTKGTTLNLVKQPSSITTTSAAGSAVGYFAITTLSNQDYFSANQIQISYPTTGSITGSLLTVNFPSGSVTVMKPNRQRPSLASEKVDGTTISYSGYTADNTRFANDGTNSEYQVVFPRYTTMTTLGYTPGTMTGSAAYGFLNSQCVITAAQTGFTANSGSNWEEISTRVWARRFTQ
jgi:hypothetical protein